MTSPSVAVITPTYNHSRCISACIESVLAQTFTDWEMIVIDDGSVDGTAHIARQYTDARIRVMTHSSRRGLEGLGATYAEAVEVTSAPLLAVLEGDDTWPPDKLERQTTRFLDKNIVLAYGAAGLIDDAGCRYAVYTRRPPGYAAENRPVGAILPYLLAQNFIVAPTVVVRRTALESVGGFRQPPGVPFVDLPTWLELAMIGEFAYDGDIVGYWRRHAGQYTTSSATTHENHLTFAHEVVERATSRGLLAEAHWPPQLLGAASSLVAVRADVASFRLALLNGSFMDAATAAQPLLRRRPGWPKWAAIALLGLGCRMLGGDLEWLFRWRNRFSWPPRRHRCDHRTAGCP